MRYIDADAVYEWYLEAFKGLIEPNEIRFSINDIRGNLQNIPTIDAVPVIRCEDCKYYDISENGVNGICRNLIIPFDSYEWCSRAEPKENEQ